MQLSGGMVQTGMRNLDSWGLYITMFMFFVGLSAGGLIISLGAQGLRHGGLRRHLARWPCGRRICCTVLAIGFVVVDLGQPLPPVGAVRVLQPRHRRSCGTSSCWPPTSSCPSCTCGPTLRAEVRARCSPLPLRVISVIALVCAVLVHSVTAWIFGAVSRATRCGTPRFWAPWFVSSALVCGTALVLVVVIAPAEGRAIWTSTSATVVKLREAARRCSCCVDLYFFGCDLLTEGFPGGDRVPRWWPCWSPARSRRSSGSRSSAAPASAVICLRADAAHETADRGLASAARHRRHLLQARAAAWWAASRFPTSSSPTWPTHMSDHELGVRHVAGRPTRASCTGRRRLEFGVTLGVRRPWDASCFFLGLKFLPLRPSDQ